MRIRTLWYDKLKEAFWNSNIVWLALFENPIPKTALEVHEYILRAMSPICAFPDKNKIRKRVHDKASPSGPNAACICERSIALDLLRSRWGGDFPRMQRKASHGRSRLKSSIACVCDLRSDAVSHRVIVIRPMLMRFLQAVIGFFSAVRRANESL